jgi:serine protease Do
MSALAELQQAVADVAAAVAPSVVAVGRGAGVVIGDNRILTNAHNLTDRRGVPVRFADGRRADGSLQAADVDGDLAVVAVDTNGAPAVTWSDATPGVGAAVVAFGAPRRGPSRVTVGFVSAVDQAFRGPRDRRIHGAIEHAAPLGRGSSGGPVVDVDGKVVGINTHRRGDGFYLAIPASEALRERVADLARGEEPAHRTLGIAVAPPWVARKMRAAVGLEQRDGLLVREVDPSGPAGHAGITRGDLIVAVDGAAVASPDDLLEALEGSADRLVLTVLRGNEEREVSVDFSGDSREEGSA